MSGHTPGPWTLFYEGTIYGDGKKVWICSLGWTSFKEFNEGKNAANARLIAAAPTMYKALQGAMVIADTVPWPDGDEYNNIRMALSQRRDAIVAALAAAEGRTP